MEFRNPLDRKIPQLALSLFVSLYFASCSLYSKQEPKENETPSATVLDTLCKVGGFTLDDNKGALLVGNEKVFMVSLKGFERTYNVDEFSVKDIENYLIEFSEQLKDPKYHLGGWIYNGRVYLDISIELPDEVSAKIAAIQNKQKAYYDFATGKEVFVGQN